MRETHIVPVANVQSLPLRHAGLAPFRQQDILIAGIDERTAPQEWGEGISPTHLVFLVVAGKVQYLGGHDAVEIAANHVIVVPCKAEKRFALVEGSLRAAWFHLCDTPHWSSLHAEAPSIIPSTRVHLIDVLQQQLLEESHFEDGAAIECCRQLASLIMHYLMRELLPSAAPGRQEMQARLAQVWNAVRNHPAYDWTVAELAERMRMSPGHFHRITRQFQQARPMEIVTRIRMELAASLLRNTDWTLEHIAAAVGYHSAFAFSHTFHRHTGLRPGAFRRK